MQASPQARTFHFAPSLPVTAAHLLMAAGPMDVQPGYQPAPPPPEGTRFTIAGGGGAEFGSAMRSVLNEVAKEGSAAGAGPPNMHTKVSWLSYILQDHRVLNKLRARSALARLLLGMVGWGFLLLLSGDARAHMHAGEQGGHCSRWLRKRGPSLSSALDAGLVLFMGNLPTPTELVCII